MNIYLLNSQTFDFKITTAIVQAYTLKKARELYFQNGFGNTFKEDFELNNSKIKSKIIGMTDFKKGKANKEKIIFISK